MPDQGPDTGPDPSPRPDPLPHHSLLARFRRIMKWMALVSIAVAVIGWRGELRTQPGPPAPWNEVTQNLGWLLIGTFFAAGLLNAGPVAASLLADDSQADEHIARFYRHADLDPGTEANEYALARLIRGRAIDTRHDSKLFELLLALTRDKVALSNPKHLPSEAAHGKQVSDRSR